MPCDTTSMTTVVADKRRQVDRLSECFRELANAEIVHGLATRMDPGESLDEHDREQWAHAVEAIGTASRQLVRLWADCVHRLQEDLRTGPGGGA